jgi:RNA polymerase sigma factor for flagellar operon FliA
MSKSLVVRFVGQMWKEYKRLNDAHLRSCLVEYYLPLSRRVAARLHKRLPAHVQREDLVSAGNFGMLTAIERFEPARGHSFEAFAKPAIRGAILDYLRDIDFLPRQERAMVSRMNVAADLLTASLGRAPTPCELRQRLGVSRPVLQRLMASFRRGTALSLSHPCGIENDLKTPMEHDLLPISPGSSVWQPLAREELKQRITRGLTRAERLVVTLYYYEGLSMREIGLAMDLSESRISQLRSSIILRLKAQLAGREQELAA